MKQQKPLPIAYQKIYNKFYLDYALSSTKSRQAALFLESWYHRKIASVNNVDSPIILEVGAGSLSHVVYEKSYEKYDIVEPKTFLWENADPRQKSRVSNYFASLELIPSGNQYSKIISIACLEHVNDLESHLQSIKGLLSPKGLFVVAIPAEGEFLWWLGWRLTTGLSFWIKYKLNYGVIMRHEHLNNAKEIIAALRKYFCIEKVHSFPFSIKNCRLYITLTCSLRNES